MCKILQAGLWWPTIHMDTKIFCRHCDICHRMEKPLHHDKMSLAPQTMLQAFKKWIVDFVGPFSPPGKRTGTHYIITRIDYLTRWAEAAPIKDCTTVIATKFLFENVVTRFGCPKILLSDQGMRFVNNIRGNLGSKMGLIIKHANNKFCELEFKNQ